MSKQAALTHTPAACHPQPLLQEPWKVRGQLGCAVALFELRLIEAYFVLPGASLYAGDHAALTKLCSRTLRTAAAPIAAPFDAALALSRSSLRRMLSSQDAVLGPWPAGREQLEDELRAYAGEAGGVWRRARVRLHWSLLLLLHGVCLAGLDTAFLDLCPCLV